MRILFAMSSPEYLRFYDDTIRELARRGHDVLLAVHHVNEGKPVRFDGIAAADARICLVGLVPARGDRWTRLAGAIRGTLDFVRYLHPDFARAPLLKARIGRQALPWMLQALQGVRTLGAWPVTVVMRGLAALDRAIPPAPALLRYLDDHTPDVVAVSPLVEPASEQVDLVRAAQARLIPVAALVASWDNLTNKGDLKADAGLVAVWNESQKREAVRYHRVPADRVEITGAQAFDRWFDRRPSRSRDEFCRAVGLETDGPFVLFTGSSIFIARAEVEVPFVRQWIEVLRGSTDPALRSLAILVRPHPYNGRAWPPDALSDLPGVAVWPRGGYDPVDEANRAGLFDSLSYCQAVVGINTSAMIEAAIVGRPVLSVETPQFAGTQNGTLHYRYLLPEHGGFLRVAATFDQHVTQLRQLLEDPEGARRELVRFVATFIRPQGVHLASTPLLADALERFSHQPAPRRTAGRWWSLALRPVLYAASCAGPLLLTPVARKRAARGPHRRARGTSSPVRTDLTS
jgi:hypothetical protein